MRILSTTFAVLALLCAASRPTASLSNASESKIVVTSFRPAQVFRDCADCPEMVVVPAGNFTIGSPANEQGHDDTEGPQRKIDIRQFAAGKFDVTRGEWAVFASDTNRKTVGGCAWAGPM